MPAANANHIKALAGLLADEYDDDDDDYLFGSSVKDKRSLFEVKNKEEEQPQQQPVAVTEKKQQPAMQVKPFMAKKKASAIIAGEGDAVHQLPQQQQQQASIETSSSSSSTARKWKPRPSPLGQPRLLQANNNIPTPTSTVAAVVPTPQHSNNSSAAPTPTSYIGEVVHNTPTAAKRAEKAEQAAAVAASNDTVAVSNYSTNDITATTSAVKGQTAGTARAIQEAAATASALQDYIARGNNSANQNQHSTTTMKHGNVNKAHNSQTNNHPNAQEEEQSTTSSTLSHPIFGRPDTFGAAGGSDQNAAYMPNVKQRASAISHWKVTKKEDKNVTNYSGRGRAVEWQLEHEGSGGSYSVASGEQDSWGGSYSVDSGDNHNTTNHHVGGDGSGSVHSPHSRVSQGSARSGRGGSGRKRVDKAPSFLAQFEQHKNARVEGKGNNVKNTPSFLSQFDQKKEQQGNGTNTNNQDGENSINGVAVPTTPRSSSSPRGVGSRDGSSKGGAMPPPSPRQALSPRNGNNVIGSGFGNGFKAAVPSPRNKGAKSGSMNSKAKGSNSKPSFLAHFEQEENESDGHSKSRVYPSMMSSPRHKPPMSPRITPTSKSKTPRSGGSINKSQTPSGNDGGKMPKGAKQLKRSSFFEDDEEHGDVSSNDVPSPSQNGHKPPTTPRKKVTPRSTTKKKMPGEEIKEAKDASQPMEVPNNTKMHIENDDEEQQSPIAVPPTPPTPISKVMQEAMDLLKTPRGLHIRVDSVEYDCANPFDDDDDDSHSNDEQEEETGLTDEECESELELARELAVALDRFLVDDSSDNDQGMDDVKEGHELALALDKLLVHDDVRDDTTNGKNKKIADENLKGDESKNVKELAVALDQFLIDRNESDESDESPVDNGEWEGWVETPRNGQTEDEGNKAQNDDDGFSFPVKFGSGHQHEETSGFEAFEPSSEKHSEPSDVFFPSSFGVEEQTTGSSSPPKTSNLSIETSFTASATVEYNIKKQPKIKIHIDGCPEFKPPKEKKDDEEMFFVARQPSPRCGDDARLFVGGQSSSSVPPSPTNEDATDAKSVSSKETSKSTSSHRSRKLNLKGFLSNKREVVEKKYDDQSPSAAGLLSAPKSEGLEMNEKVDNDASSTTAFGCLETVAEGQFFAAPATPTMNSHAQIRINQAANVKVDDGSGVSFGFGSAKKTKGLLKRIKKTPLGGRNKKKSAAFGSLSDEL